LSAPSINNRLCGNTLSGLPEREGRLAEASPDTLLKDTLYGIAVTALLAAVAVSIPFIGLLCLLLLPQPVIFYRLKLGRRQGLLIIGASLFLLLLLGGGPFADAAFILGLLGLGFLMAECIERGCPADITIGYACGAVLLAGFFAVAVYAGLSAAGIGDLMNDYVSGNLEATLAIYEKSGMPEETIQVLKGSIEQIAGILVRMLPSLIAAGLLFTAWLNLLAARTVLGRWLGKHGDFGQLNRWQAPDWLVWGVIAGIAALLMPNRAFRLAGSNVMMVLIVIYFFQGIAVLSYYFEQKRFPLLLRGMIYALIAVQQLFLLIVAALGFFDVWADFRRLSAPKSDSDGPSGQ
jgi:uncharacterized protein YybS (DUF2232 family)